MMFSGASENGEGEERAAAMKNLNKQDDLLNVFKSSMSSENQCSQDTADVLCKVPCIRVWLVFSDKPPYGMRDGDTLLVGRAQECSVSIANNSTVSRVHARIRCEFEELFIEDLGSKNGTILNRERLEPFREVSAPLDARLMLGSEFLRFKKGDTCPSCPKKLLKHWSKERR